jgi:hypothetical protein
VSEGRSSGARVVATVKRRLETDPAPQGNERIPGELIQRTGASNTLACAAPPLTPKPPRVGPRLKSNESELFDLLRHRPGMRESRPRPAIGAIRVQ